MADLYSPHYHEGWALVVGIDDYKHVPKLNFASEDAKGVYDVLEHLGFPATNMTLLMDGDATAEAIRKGVPFT